jgi:hypothetical protein
MSFFTKTSLPHQNSVSYQIPVVFTACRKYVFILQLELPICHQGQLTYLVNCLLSFSVTWVFPCCPSTSFVIPDALSLFRI